MVRPLLSTSVGLIAAVVAFAIATTQADEPIDIYGKKISFLKVFGHSSYKEFSNGRVTGALINHAAGVLVDRSRHPNTIYVADTGNNRILGFRSYDSKKPDLIFGQPNEFTGAPNGDCNIGIFGNCRRDTLCLINIPGNPNSAEQWMRLNFDVDRFGNLYFPDHGNNRVLVYAAPFADDKSQVLGDTLPDFVLGQPDFESNGVNHGKGPGKCDARSLHIGYFPEGGWEYHVSSRGVSVDAQGNVWVADTFNGRVLRFPRKETKADLVLGQPNFASGEFLRELDNAPLNRMGTPVCARVHPDTGELYVVDEFGGFHSRILVFKPPFKNGMNASRVIMPKQKLAGDYSGPYRDYKDGYRFTHCTGLVFNPIKSEDWVNEKFRTHRYRDGVIWIHDGEGQTGPRTLLLDKDGEILVAISAPDTTTLGGRWYNYEKAGIKGSPFNLQWPGGMIGFDDANNIYLADEGHNRIARYALPYRAGWNGDTPILPAANGGLLSGHAREKRGPAHSSQGTGIAVIGDNLVLRDQGRFMVWENYLDKPSGAEANSFPPQPNGFSSEVQTSIYEDGCLAQGVDDQNRLWVVGGPDLSVYPLPLKAETRVLREYISLYWADDPDVKVDHDLGRPLAYEKSSGRIWVYDLRYHRLLRVKIPDRVEGKFLVDAVIGQNNKTENRINRGMKTPDAASLGDVADIKFDRLGNFFVVDNTFELHPNGRILMFAAEEMKGINTLFPNLHAKQVFIAERFDQNVWERTIASREYPHSPTTVAFNSRNEMVVGNDGYWRGDPQLRMRNQLFLYRNPLSKATPDAVIELPLGTAGEIAFDQHDNLIVLDATYGHKVWVVNYERDPAWLRELR
jgi:DNA-binding beta-propeller fold protein YncE